MHYVKIVEWSERINVMLAVAQACFMEVVMATMKKRYSQNYVKQLKKQLSFIKKRENRCLRQQQEKTMPTGC